MNATYLWVKLTCGVLATIGLYSVLYRETKLYRFFEHLFLGLAAGYILVSLWRDTLKPQWWDKMAGSVTIDPLTHVRHVDAPGYWVYAFLLPIGLMAYLVFSKKHNWMSRIPIGVILGFWSGQQVQIWWNRWGAQIYSSMQPVWPTTMDSFTRPSIENMSQAQASVVTSHVYPSQALSNLVFVITILASLSYFFFSFDMKNKLLRSSNTLGRWLLMVGFGAIFGSTVMARFVLEIDRMAYIFVEWIQQTSRVFGGG
ncbi:MAG TPA: hypothetical protein VNI20_14005 [Fimbriimonadaceae bacterium]|nr:hypothetical protein [Fimbriimonadaceae bacterium]